MQGDKSTARVEKIPAKEFSHARATEEIKKYQPIPQILNINPRPQTQHPRPQTPHPEPQTPNPTPHTPHPTFQTPNPKPRTQILREARGQHSPDGCRRHGGGVGGVGLRV